RTVPELIKLAKESPTPLTYSTPGVGLMQHLSIEFMKQRFGFEATHVPYRNTPQSVTDIAAGHVAMGFAEAGAAVPLIKDGKLRALAVSASERLPVLPDVPPFAQAANAADWEAVSWHVLLGPAASGDEADHGVGRHGQAGVGSGLDSVRYALGRWRTQLHQVRAGEVGRAGAQARARGHAVAKSVRDSFRCEHGPLRFPSPA